MTLHKRIWATAFAVVLGSLGVVAGATITPSAEAKVSKATNPNPGPIVVTTNALVLPVGVLGARASMKDVASGKVVIGAWMNIKADVPKSSRRCITTDGWNSLNGVNGRFSFRDYNMRLCPSRRSPTGWVKVGGGRTGKNCGNVASPFKPPFPAVKAKTRVIEVRKLINVRIKLHAQANVQAAHPLCPGTFAWGRAVADVLITVRQYFRSRKSAFVDIRERFVAEARAEAFAQVECVPPPTTTVTTGTTVTTTTQPPPQPRPAPGASLPEQHEKIATRISEVCGTATSQWNQNGLTVFFTVDRGDVMQGTTRRVAPDTWCFDYRAPATAGTDTICINANDSFNPVVRACRSFNVRSAPTPP